MDDILIPLELEHSALIAEAVELDTLSHALNTQQHKIDHIEQEAKELLNQIRETAANT